LFIWALAYEQPTLELFEKWEIIACLTIYN
jgi:hypothetical protein